ncbi:MAG: hypothetical protein WBA57_27040 [Elainellaceae cyanobacterium]
MAKAIDRSNLNLVELDQGVLAKTAIPENNHAALRSGFAGYTSNPRWSASKFVAWRTGKAWKQALEAGKLAVRSTDSLLVPAEEAVIAEEVAIAPEESQTKGQKPTFLSNLIHRSGRMQEATYTG